MSRSRYLYDDYVHRETLQSMHDSTTSDGVSAVAHILRFCVIFGYGASVSEHKMRLQLRNYRAVLFGMLCQFVLFPLIGYGTAMLFDLPTPSAIILLVITSSPSGHFSSWWCSILNADLPLSLNMTALSTIAGVFLLPLNVFIYTSTAYAEVGPSSRNSAVRSIDYGVLLTTVGVVSLAIACGMYCGSKFATPQNPNFRKYANRGGNMTGVTLLLFSILVAIFGSFNNTDRTGYDELLEEDPFVKIYFSAGLPCLLSLTVANIGCMICARLSPPESIALVVECTYRNTGIASALALTMFSGEDLKEAALLPLWYGIVESVVISVYMIWAWKTGWTKAPANEKFLVILSTCYEFRSLEGDTDSDSDRDMDSKESEDDEDYIDQLGLCSDHSNDNDDERDVQIIETEITPEVNGDTNDS
mmetsp:Transcript_27934/g.42787  ORF Transcript_27934/g.42787 Transcript_27934/m.42787 type:complete len:417 (+) Transcript_27934:174-1424(+)